LLDLCEGRNRRRRLLAKGIAFIYPKKSMLTAKQWAAYVLYKEKACCMPATDLLFFI
jgi:hypothetical protein